MYTCSSLADWEMMIHGKEYKTVPYVAHRKLMVKTCLDFDSVFEVQQLLRIELQVIRASMNRKIRYGLLAGNFTHASWFGTLAGSKFTTS